MVRNLLFLGANILLVALAVSLFLMVSIEPGDDAEGKRHEEWGKMVSDRLHQENVSEQTQRLDEFELTPLKERILPSYLQSAEEQNLKNDPDLANGLYRALADFADLVDFNPSNAYVSSFKFKGFKSRTITIREGNRTIMIGTIVPDRGRDQVMVDDD